MSTPPEGEPTVVSIHDHELPEKRAFDLQDIVSALGERGLGWTWCILYDFEAYGPGESLRELTQTIWQARPGGLWLSGPEFAHLAQGIHQTIDGEFQAFPARLDPRSILTEELRTSFPRSRAELVIRISDGAIFEVYAKHPDALLVSVPDSLTCAERRTLPATSEPILLTIHLPGIFFQKLPGSCADLVMAGQATVTVSGALEIRSVANPLPEQIQLGAPVHLPLEQLESIHLSFGLSLTPP